MVVSNAAAGLIGFTQRQVDRVVTPESRQKAFTQTTDFAAARPILFAFLLAQLTFSLIPLLLFASFVASAFLFAFGAALLFTLFWLGVSLAILVPTLFITGGIGILAWAWAVASFIVVRWLYGVLQGIAGADGLEVQRYNGTKKNGIQVDAKSGGGDSKIDGAGY
ncbi:hypothetical protein B0T25DRAFT_514986 [Lasiosphaeria hispida]|uniref:Uncharacterized protein n=1 Tax=Lasiosphaeria hispida TaxID=260671 RepID=A0AAJ0HQ87_9PEZI|nr:hypothetical protein B0T25DRAFT_514986 [Lasiosphaeria hispida]